MTLERLILNIELQSCIIKVYDFEKEDYIAAIPYTYEQCMEILDQYGEYYVKFIYPENGNAIIEICEE